MTTLATMAAVLCAGAAFVRSRVDFVVAAACGCGAVLLVFGACMPTQASDGAEKVAHWVLVWSFALASHVAPVPQRLAAGQAPRDPVDLTCAALAVLGGLHAPQALGLGTAVPSTPTPFAACALCTAAWLAWVSFAASRSAPTLAARRWDPLESVVAWSAQHRLVALTLVLALAAWPLAEAGVSLVRQPIRLGVLASLSGFGALVGLALCAKVRHAALCLLTPVTGSLCALGTHAASQDPVAPMVWVFALSLPASLLTWRAVMPPFGVSAGSARAEFACGAASLIPALAAAGALACGSSAGHAGRATAVGLLVSTAASLLVLPNVHGPHSKPMTWPNPPAPGSSTHRELTFLRFAALRPGTRYWAAGKLAFDPMFRQLEPFLPDDGRILDLGCGYGLVGAWTVMARPNVRLVGVDPLLSRVRVARYVLEGRATAHVGDAQELLSARLPSWAAEPFDAALCIDVTHQGSGLVEVLAGLHRVLRQGGVLLLRTATKQHEQRESWSMRLERLLVRARGQRVIAFPSAAQVTAALLAAGFRDVRAADRVRGEPEMLFIARRCG